VKTVLRTRQRGDDVDRLERASARLEPQPVCTRFLDDQPVTIRLLRSFSIDELHPQGS
jgi:hypothetical protein